MDAAMVADFSRAVHDGRKRCARSRPRRSETSGRNEDDAPVVGLMTVEVRGGQHYGSGGVTVVSENGAGLFAQHAGGVATVDSAPG